MTHGKIDWSVVVTECWSRNSLRGVALGAIMPFVKISTGTRLSNGRVEGAIVAMFAWDVAETWGVGGQVEIDAVYAEDDYDVEFVHTVGESNCPAIFSPGLTGQLNEDLVFGVGDTSRSQRGGRGGPGGCGDDASRLSRDPH